MTTTPPDQSTPRIDATRTDAPRICDYEGTDYRTRFWENQGRNYEDAAERLALRRLLPTSGRRFLEIGAGFGRVTDEYHGYEQVILLDYSRSQLADAQTRLGRSPRYAYVAADAYRMPFKSGVFDGASVIRVLHHIADVPRVMAQIRRTLAPRGTFILEYANKRNLKAVLRYLLRRQAWSPFDLAPVEFVELNFDFHPAYIRRELNAAQFTVERELAVSFFRIEPIKRLIPIRLLTRLESVMQGTGAIYSPSVFVRSTAIGDSTDHVRLHTTDGDILPLLACPECGGDLVRTDLVSGDDEVMCTVCARRYAVRDGIYDFKTAL